MAKAVYPDECLYEERRGEDGTLPFRLVGWNSVSKGESLGDAFCGTRVGYQGMEWCSTVKVLDCRCMLLYTYIHPLLL
jgi:hypothetical protein